MQQLVQNWALTRPCAACAVTTAPQRQSTVNLQQLLCCAWVAWELACTELALMGNFAKKSTTHAKIAMTSPWIQGGRDCTPPPCTQAVLMASAAWVVEILAKLSMRAASVHANPHATHAQHNSPKLGAGMAMRGLRAATPPRVPSDNRSPKWN
jgi:hypothetical protein